MIIFFYPFSLLSGFFQLARACMPFPHVLLLFLASLFLCVTFWVIIMICSFSSWFPLFFPFFLFKCKSNYNQFLFFFRNFFSYFFSHTFTLHHIPTYIITYISLFSFFCNSISRATPNLFYRVKKKKHGLFITFACILIHSHPLSICYGLFLPSGLSCGLFCWSFFFVLPKNPFLT
jgi:hypothetical protein